MWYRPVAPTGGGPTPCSLEPIMYGADCPLHPSPRGYNIGDGPPARPACLVEGGVLLQGVAFRHSTKPPPLLQAAGRAQKEPKAFLLPAPAGITRSTLKRTVLESGLHSRAARGSASGGVAEPFTQLTRHLRLQPVSEPWLSASHAMPASWHALSLARLAA